MEAITFLVVKRVTVNSVGSGCWFQVFMGVHCLLIPSHIECRYERFIVSLEEATKDTLPFLKEKALKVRDQPYVFCPFEVFFNSSLIVGMVCVDPALSCPRLPTYMQSSG